MTYIVPGSITSGIFIDRPNRFTALVRIDDEIIKCHLPNPGRMNELLNPETSKVFIRPSSDSKRKTDASLVAVEINNEIIQLDSNLVARWLPTEFYNDTVPSLKKWKVVRKEPTIGNHRFDFILENSHNEEVITEVKSTTKVVDSIACFPDGISKRATEQAKSLVNLSNEGKYCMILFIVKRKANSFRPCTQIDPKYSKIFFKLLKSDVKIHVIQSETKIIARNGNQFIQVNLKNELSISI